MEKLINIMKELRNPKNGCPWDIEQTFSSIAPYTIEEAYEVVDAIQRQNMEDLREELGDLLFQVVFHAQMAAELDVFGIDDVVAGIEEKMLRRHPHVFGGQKIDSALEQSIAWETHKAAERQKKVEIDNIEESILDGIPVSLPALTKAVKLQKRAARVGFDWTSVSEIYEKIIEELDEVRQEIETKATRDRVEDEVGDLLFAVSNLARHLDIDPEAAVRVSNAKFERRFRTMETMARAGGNDFEAMSLDDKEALYQQVKLMEKNNEY